MTVPFDRKDWTAALRSGEFLQGKNLLRSGDNRFCCLGVLATLAVRAGVIPEPFLKPSTSTSPDSYFFDGCNSMLSKTIMDWAGVSEEGRFLEKKEGCSSLVGWNDTGGTFSEIADLIDSNPKGLFKQETV